MAEKFGWTPTQADGESAVMIDWLISIAGIVDEVKAEAYDV